MLISTHLPPPVMMESTENLALVTHILCCSWAICFSAAPSSENDHGSINLASNTGRHPAHDGMLHTALDPGEDLAGIAFIPVPIERLGHQAELDDKVA